MNADRNNKKLDEFISQTISREKPEFDFDKWKKAHQSEIQIYESQEKSGKTTSATFDPNIWRIMLWYKAACIAATFFIICSLAVCFVLSIQVTDLRNELELARRDVAPAITDDTTTINLYLREHQDVVARHASISSTVPQPAPMRVNQHDILYYELFDDKPEYMNPGIIIKGSPYQQKVGSSEAPVISNGHTLTLSEARQAADFQLITPVMLDPGYVLDEVRKIDSRDALQLLYTDGIHSVSLFEQPLDGQRGLKAKDFREYAIYQNEERTGGIILAWRDDELSYVLIGNAEMSQMMHMAQSISARK